MLYLAKIEYRKTRYMDTKAEEKKEFRLVEAESKEQADEKAVKYFDDMTEEYAVYYSVTNVVVLETIS